MFKVRGHFHVTNRVDTADGLKKLIFSNGMETVFEGEKSITTLPMGTVIEISSHDNNGVIFFKKDQPFPKIFVEDIDMTIDQNVSFKTQPSKKVIVYSADGQREKAFIDKEFMVLIGYHNPNLAYFRTHKFPDLDWLTYNAADDRFYKALVHGDLPISKRPITGIWPYETASALDAEDEVTATGINFVGHKLEEMDAEAQLKADPTNVIFAPDYLKLTDITHLPNGNIKKIYSDGTSIVEGIVKGKKYIQLTLPTGVFFKIRAGENPKAEIYLNKDFPLPKIVMTNASIILTENKGFRSLHFSKATVYSRSGTWKKVFDDVKLASDADHPNHMFFITKPIDTLTQKKQSMVFDYDLHKDRIDFNDTLTSDEEGVTITPHTVDETHKPIPPERTSSLSEEAPHEFPRIQDQIPPQWKEWNPKTTSPLDKDVVWDHEDVD